MNTTADSPSSVSGAVSSAVTAAKTAAATATQAHMNGGSSSGAQAAFGRGMLVAAVAAPAVVVALALVGW